MTSTKQLNTTVPLYLAGLRLEGRPCLIVGGGAVAVRKLQPLLEAGARVTIVAPELGPGLRSQLAAARSGRGLRWLEREFSPEDVEGQMLVFAATDDAALNEEVGRLATQAGGLANLATDPDESGFHVPSAFRRGSLQVGVLTGGKAPALAASLRREFEAQVGEEWGEVVELLGELRNSLGKAEADQEWRRELNRELADLDFIELLAEGGLEAVRAAVSRSTRLRGGEV